MENTELKSNPEKIWQQALQHIKSELSEQSYKTWFEFVGCDQCNESEIELLVPDKFYGEWLKEHYQEIIKSSLYKINKTRPEIVYKIQSVSIPVSKDEELPQKTQALPKELNQFESSFKTNVNPTYDFDSFVVGPENRFSHAAAVAISELPAKMYNPLFIYGASGLGKTHLLQAIANKIKETFPNKKVLYTSSEEFTNSLINAIRNRSTAAFRQKFRNLDILLIDDIQFIAGKESTQEEFFHTFNALYDAQKQIVLSSDRSPKEIPTLEKRLLSRFEWGLITDMQPPNFETRVAILKMKLERENVEVPNEILFYIAENIKNNIRELEGALIRVCAYATLTDNLLTLENVQNVLKTSVKEEKKITIPLIQEYVSKAFGLKPADLRSKKRTKTLSHPRQIAMYLTRKHTSHSFPEIGENFGGRGHATVVHACNRIAGLIEKNDPSVSMVEEIKESIFKIT